MARRAVMARWAKARLLLLFLGLLAPAAYSQGTLYTFMYSGDDSPLHLSAKITATWEAVAGSRTVTMTNMLSGYMEQDGRRVPLVDVFLPILPDGTVVLAPKSLSEKGSFVTGRRNTSPG